MADASPTKEKMLRMIADRDMTLSDISRELHLAPSTVSQHLHELVEIGALREVDNGHFGKFKYYGLNREFAGADAKRKGAGRLGAWAGRRRPLYALAFLAAIFASFIMVYGMGPNVQKSSTVQVDLTDPPIVPAGTQALYMNYSSVSVRAVSNGTSEWIQTNSSGTANLLSLVNESQVIAGVEVPHNLRIDMAGFNITSAYIEVNGTAYPVEVRGHHILAQVYSDGRINSSSQVIVDISPVVLEGRRGNSTSFVMETRARAVLAFMPSRHRFIRHGRIMIGERFGLGSRTLSELYGVWTNSSDAYRSLANGTANYSGVHG